MVVIRVKTGCQVQLLVEYLPLAMARHHLTCFLWLNQWQRLGQALPNMVETFRPGSARPTPPEPSSTTSASSGSTSSSSTAQAGGRTFWETVGEWQRRHRAFVKKVHNFRIPLSPTGR